MSVSFAAQLGDDVRDAARRAGQGLSAWLADAAAAKLRAEALGEFLDRWEQEHGPLTHDELAQAEIELRLRLRDGAGQDLGVADSP